jgi:predicted CXXCH cytochrome family protein
MDPTYGWSFGWDATSGDYYRSTNAADYCGKCHISPSAPPPLTASVDVPFDVNLVNDTEADADGLPHDQFDLAWFLSDSAHGSDTYDPGASGTPSYPGCPPGQPCELACTACHDFHGSSNAYMLREDIASPDYGPIAVTSATWAGGTATLTLVGPHEILVSWYVTVTGTSGYEGTWEVTAVTADTISFELSGSASDTSGGTLSTNIEGYGGLNANADRMKLQAFCLTCHPEQSSTHGLVDDDTEPTLCTSCHNHDPNSSSPF